MKLYELEYNQEYSVKEIDWNISRDTNKVSLYVNIEDAINDTLLLNHITNQYRGATDNIGG